VAGEALFGFVGVVLGFLTTSVLTIYKDRLAARHDIAIRDRVRNNLDRHPNYVLAAYMASGT
jgi:hypothetical protein